MGHADYYAHGLSRLHHKCDTWLIEVNNTPLILTEISWFAMILNFLHRSHLLGSSLFWQIYVFYCVCWISWSCRMWCTAAVI